MSTGKRRGNPAQGTHRTPAGVSQGGMFARSESHKGTGHSLDTVTSPPRGEDGESSQRSADESARFYALQHALEWYPCHL